MHDNVFAYKAIIGGINKAVLNGLLCEDTAEEVKEFINEEYLYLIDES